jgi:hypothetical protein
MSPWRQLINIRTRIKKTVHNSVGLINCLLQPGLFYLCIQKSMREEFTQLIKSCGTWTVPAAETESIGLQADARVVMVFASLSGQFQCNMTNPAHLSGPRHLDSFIVTKKISSTYRDFAKTHANPDTDGNSLNRRAVSAKIYQPTSNS